MCQFHRIVIPIILTCFIATNRVKNEGKKERKRNRKVNKNLIQCKNSRMSSSSV